MEHIEEERTIATTSYAPPIIAEPKSTISWRAVIAGVVVALASQILLTTLGLAIGATTISAGPSARTVEATGIGVGIWYLISTLISVFFGGLVAGISARELSRTLGSIEGLLVWALSLLLTIWFVTSGVQSVIAQASGMIVVDPMQLQGQMPSPGELRMGGPTARDIGQASTIASWIAFGTLLFSALCGVLGGIIGARVNRRRLTQTVERRSVPQVQTYRATEA